MGMRLQDHLHIVLFLINDGQQGVRRLGSDLGSGGFKVQDWIYDDGMRTGRIGDDVLPGTGIWFVNIVNDRIVFSRDVLNVRYLTLNMGRATPNAVKEMSA